MVSVLNACNRTARTVRTALSDTTAPRQHDRFGNLAACRCKPSCAAISAVSATRGTRLGTAIAFSRRGICQEYPLGAEAGTSHITVGKWGKNLAVRFPADVARELGLHEGEQVEIETEGDAIVIRRAIPHFTLDDVFRGRSPKAWRAAYADAFDWSNDVGREMIEE